MSKPNGIIFYSMIANWIIVTFVGIMMAVILRDLRGLEWFGSPLLACFLLGVIMTVLYFATKNRAWKITEVLIFWLASLFVLTIINMATLAQCILDSWEDYQAMPIMGTFQLLLMAIAVHLQVSYIKKEALNSFILWTTLLFLLTASTQIFLALSLFHGWYARFQQYPIIGVGIWTFLMFTLYLSPNGQRMPLFKVFFYWSWFLFIGIGVSMVLTYVYALASDPRIWPLYPTVSTFGLALFATILLLVSSRKKGKSFEKAEPAPKINES